VAGEQQDRGGALTSREASDAVGDLGWRYVLGTLMTEVRVASLAQGGDVVAGALAAAGEDGERCLSADARHDRVVLRLASRDEAAVTTRETDVARRISAAVGGLGLRTDAGAAPGGRPVQLLEIAVAGRCSSSRSPWTPSTSRRSARSGRP
jgi:4a-hydroxytetrahydrobiopterin dehydratase